MNFQSLPEQSDYEAAVALTEENLIKVGGPWVLAHRTEQSAHDRFTLFQAVQTIGLFASEVEPLDDNERPIDSLRRRTHAFKHGFLIGQQVVDLAHNDSIAEQGLIPALQLMIYENSEGNNDRADTIVSIGENGLALMGDSARERIDIWSDEAVSDIGARRMYALGCGAVVLAAYSIHKAYNDKLFEYFLTQAGFSGQS